MAGKQNDIASASGTPARPGASIDLDSSVAGEEDPGASIELANVRGTEAPGDEAPAGTPGTGENVCPQCGGTGRLGASACPHCEGTGKVIVGTGGA